MDSHAIFLTIYCLAIPIILSRKAMRRMSIEYHIDLRWYFAWLICMVVITVIAAFPTYGGSYVTTVQVLFPLVLTGLDSLTRKSVDLCFREYRHKTDGQAMLIALYIWRMEVSRFDCFIALFLGWKSGTVPLRDVIANAGLSILGEIWTHSGIREVGEKWLELKMGCILLKSDFPVRQMFASFRMVLEWVLPAISFSILCLLELRRDYLVVPDDDIVIQLQFFTSVRLYHHLVEIVLTYYFLEIVSLVLCCLIAKKAGYAQKSVVGTLGWHSIISLGFGLVALEDVGFYSKFWSAVVDIN